MLKDQGVSDSVIPTLQKARKTSSRKFTIGPGSLMQPGVRLENVISGNI